MKRIIVGLIVCCAFQFGVAAKDFKLVNGPSPVTIKSIVSKDSIQKTLPPVLLNDVDPYSDQMIYGKSPAEKAKRQERRRQTIRDVSKTTEDVLILIIEVTFEVMKCLDTYY